MQDDLMSEGPVNEFERVLSLLGNIDVYLLDQVMKRRIGPGKKILDAGCGSGRNLHFLMACGCDVWGVDSSADAISVVRQMAEAVAGKPDTGRFRAEAIENLSFEDGLFDVVVCNAVLHFASGERHFSEMLDQLWRVLTPGGVFFARLTSSIGIEGRIEQVGERTFLLPDGTERFLADEEFLLRHTRRLGAEFLEPIKTVNVQGKRCMTNWVMTKPTTAG